MIKPKFRIRLYSNESLQNSWHCAVILSFRCSLRYRYEIECTNLTSIYFFILQGANEENSSSYLTNLQRRKRIKEQAKKYRLFLYNSLVTAMT